MKFRVFGSAAAIAKRKLMVGHIVRFDPTIQALKQHIDAGELGRIFQVACKRVSPFPHRVRDVGVVLDLAPHDLDLIRYLTGKEPSHIYAQVAHRIHTEYEDQLTAQLRFSDGILGMLEINWLTPTKVRDVIILGEGGVFRADCIRQELHFLENAECVGDVSTGLQALTGVSEGQSIQFPVEFCEPIKAELKAFVDAVRNDTAVPVTGADGLAALELALALLKSGAEGRVIEM